MGYLPYQLVQDVFHQQYGYIILKKMFQLISPRFGGFTFSKLEISFMPGQPTQTAKVPNLQKYFGHLHEALTKIMAFPEQKAGVWYIEYIYIYI